MKTPPKLIILLFLLLLQFGAAAQTYVASREYLRDSIDPISVRPGQAIAIVTNGMTVAYMPMVGTAATNSPVEFDSVRRAGYKWKHDWRGDVRAFGALGNDATDDTAALLEMIDYAETHGKTYFFPPGTYYVTNTLVHNGNAWNVSGGLDLTTTIRVSAEDVSAMEFGGLGHRITGLRLLGPTDTDPVGTAAGLLLTDGFRRSRLEKLTIRGFPYGIRATQDGANPSNMQLNNTWIDLSIYDYSIRGISQEESGTQNFGANWYVKQSQNNPVLTVTGASVNGNEVTYTVAEDATGLQFGNLFYGAGFVPTDYNVTVFCVGSTSNTVSVVYEVPKGAITTLGSLTYNGSTNVIQEPVFLGATWNLDTINIEWNRGTNAIVFGNRDEYSSVTGLHIEGFIGVGPTNNWVLHTRTAGVVINGGQFVNNSGYPGTYNAILGNNSVFYPFPGSDPQNPILDNPVVITANDILMRDLPMGAGATLVKVNPASEIHRMTLNDKYRFTTRAVNATPQFQDSSSIATVDGMNQDTNHWRYPNHTTRFGAGLMSRELAPGWAHDGAGTIHAPLPGFDGNGGVVAWVGKLQAGRDNSIFSLSSSSNGVIEGGTNAMSLEILGSGKVRLRMLDGVGGSYVTDAPNRYTSLALDDETAFILARKNATNVDVWINGVQCYFLTFPTNAWSLSTNLFVSIGGAPVTLSGLGPRETMRFAVAKEWDRSMYDYPDKKLLVTVEGDVIVRGATNNGGFETGNFAPWVNFNDGGLGVVSIQSTNAYEGTYAAKIEIGSDDEICGVQWTNLLTSGTKYRVSFKAYSSTSSSVQLGDIQTDAQLFGNWQLNAGWTEIETIVTASIDPRIRISRAIGTPNGEILLDDINIVELPSVTPWLADINMSRGGYDESGNGNHAVLSSTGEPVFADWRRTIQMWPQSVAPTVGVSDGAVYMDSTGKLYRRMSGEWRGASGLKMLTFGTRKDTSPTDATDYHVNDYTILTGASTAPIPIWDDIVVERVDVHSVVTGLGTSEAVQCWLRQNGTNYIALGNLDWSSGRSVVSTSGLTNAFVSGDTMALRVLTPNWVTNPTGVQLNVRVWYR